MKENDKMEKCMVKESMYGLMGKCILVAIKMGLRKDKEKYILIMGNDLKVSLKMVKYMVKVYFLLKREFRKSIFGKMESFKKVSGN